MADTVDHFGEPKGSARVMPTDKGSVEAWAREFGVSEQELLIAVLKVGTWPAAIERHLSLPKDYS